MTSALRLPTADIPPVSSHRGPSVSVIMSTYNRSNIIGAFRRLEKRLGIARFNPYSYRHSYITEALERGLTADIVAELVGNSPKTIAKYYSHLESKRNTLRESARKAVG